MGLKTGFLNGDDMDNHNIEDHNKDHHGKDNEEKHIKDNHKKMFFFKDFLKLLFFMPIFLFCKVDNTCNCPGRGRGGGEEEGEMSWEEEEGCIGCM